MATQAEIRQQIRDYLYSARPLLRPFATRITGSYTNVATTVNVTDGNDWAKGDILENPATVEQMFVSSVAANALTVIRAYNGTTALASVGTTDVIEKNPRFPTSVIDQVTDDVLFEFERKGVFVWGTGEITTVQGQYVYELNVADMLDIASVYYREPNYFRPVPLPFTLNQMIDVTSGFTQARQLHIPTWGEVGIGAKIHYTYRKRIDAVGDLYTRQEALVSAGATYKLLQRTITTETHDPGKRTDRTSQPGQGGRDSRELRLEYENLVREESQLLKYEANRVPGNVQVNRANRFRS
jgi:hypothetical protein